MGVKIVFRLLAKATEISHYYISQILSDGDLAVDATVGNGNDTLFLAKLVGNGHVIGFDIQEAAIKNTQNLLYQYGYYDRVSLYKLGHENMDKVVKQSVKAIMFNLGYLPKGDHKIITQPETTLKALKKSLILLKKGGILSVVVYPGAYWWRRGNVSC